MGIISSDLKSHCKAESPQNVGMAKIFHTKVKGVHVD